MKTAIPGNLTGKDLFQFLIANKSLLIDQKKYEPKHADAVSFSMSLLTDKGLAVKANTPVSSDPNTIQVLSVINTTMWMDSHDDVHINGIWKKSLSENKNLYLLEEHKMSFRGIITDQVKAYTQSIPWASLGLSKSGNTEALIFESTITRKRNEYMFEQYSNGHVKNHSVGMRYVKLDMAINDPDYKEEFAIWNKYIDLIANREEAEERGYFFPVTEAKAIEGSAVPIGSNKITPTLSVTSNEPQKSTQKKPKAIYKHLLTDLKIFQ